MPILPGKPAKAKLVAALMAPDRQLIEKALSVLEPAYGPVELSSAVFPFTYSDYYTKEMGEGLLKMFCSFRRLIEPDEIVSLKFAAIECERSFLRETTRESSAEILGQYPPQKTASAGPGGRAVNIDPGYLDRTKLVLATTKDCSHRICIGQGIYGDVEMIYKSASFVCLEWTYPDYRAALAIEFFNKVRSVYLADLREAGQKAQE
jgi:hypothetical protein